MLLLTVLLASAQYVIISAARHHGVHDQYLEEVEPTQQGPVLFPNDAPPPPRPPLIVTSRPLTESIARSELNPTPAPQLQNSDYSNPKLIPQDSDYGNPKLIPEDSDYSNPDYNSIAQQSRLNRVQYPPRLILVNAVTGKPVYQGVQDYDVGVKPLGRFGGNGLGYQVRQPVHPDRYQSNRVDDDESDLSQDSKYAFSYKVRDQKTGDDFSHHQESSGSATNGEYRVRLPDGRTQIVSYTADENGYKADVRYDDEKQSGSQTVNGINPGSQTSNGIYSGSQVANGINSGSQVANGINSGSQIANGINSGSQIANGIAKQYAYRGQNPDYTTNTKQNFVSKANGDYIYNNVNYADNSVVNYDNHNYDNERQFYKVAPVKEDYQYADLVKDYDLDNEDYSLEYNGKNNNYQPHRSKFSHIAQKVNDDEEIQGNAVLKPSIEELRNLFLNKKPIQPTPDYLLYNKIPVEINVPSTTPRPDVYDSTSEHVVIIGTTKPTLYTNVRSTSAPQYQRFSTPSFLPSTARSYNNIDFSGPKPVLSDSFINRINKYLNY